MTVGSRHYWDKASHPADVVEKLRADLLERFGAARLEETAWPTYTNRLLAARWLAYERVRVAAKLTRRVGAVRIAVDFGSGLGVGLPYLAARAEHVYAVESDAEITSFVVSRLDLPNVTVVSDASELDGPVDLLWALDVFEHVPELAALTARLAKQTAAGGVWIVSGPTENLLYRAMRRVARTSGEGHVRGIDRVFEIVSASLGLVTSQRLPLDLPLWASLFDVGLFERRR